MKTLLKELSEKYENYKEDNLHSDFITHNELKNKILRLKESKNFAINEIGKSVQGREIYSIRFGKGKRKILAWSQMHGDEPTATTALFDIINFFQNENDLTEIKNEILNELEIHFIPMLNPDGAEKYKRENSFNIDLNRDAIEFQSDESKLLWDYAQNLKPEFAFNLHDQNSYYAVGRNKKTAALSFLAPPIDYVKSINYTREKSMQLIALIFDHLDEIIPGHIARYKDDYEPRAFGDNLMKSGISTILIESGYYPDDEKKDFVRKLNFVSIILSLYAITKEKYKNIFYSKYFEILENNELFFDLLLKNLTLNYNFRKFEVDIAINRIKKLNIELMSFYYESKIAAIGDLSIFYGIEEKDLSGCEINFDENLSVDSDANFMIYQNSIPVYEVKSGFLFKTS